MFRKCGTLGEMMIVDLHNHSRKSKNTTLKLRNYISAYQLLDSEEQVALGITEHNAVSSKSGVYEGLLVLPGMEVLNDYGDFLVYGVTEEVLQHRKIKHLVAEVHKQGGVIIAAHPFRSNGVFNMLPKNKAERVIELMDAVEVKNGRGNPKTWAKAEVLASRFDKPMVAGSDAHLPGEEFHTGTLFEDEISSVADLVRAIQQGRCRAVTIR